MTVFFIVAIANLAPCSNLHSIAVFVSDIGRALTVYRDTLELPLIRQDPPGAADTTLLSTAKAA